MVGALEEDSFAEGVNGTQGDDSALVLAWISFAPTPFAALGGTVHAFPFANQLFAFADAQGDFTGGITWPTGDHRLTPVDRDPFRIRGCPGNHSVPRDASG